MATSYLGCPGKTLAIATPPISLPSAQQIHRTKEIYRGAVPAGRPLQTGQQAQLDRHCIPGLFVSSMRP